MSSPPNPRLLEQHNRLRLQLEELSSKMNQVLEKEQLKKQQQHKRPHRGGEQQKSKSVMHTISPQINTKLLTGKPQEVNETNKIAVASIQLGKPLSKLQAQLKLQQHSIALNKVELFRLQKELENNYDINKIQRLQNQARSLKKEINIVLAEHQALKKLNEDLEVHRPLGSSELIGSLKPQEEERLKLKTIIESQKKNNNQKISEQDHPNKLVSLQQQLKLLTHKAKKQTESINQKQRYLRKLHQALCGKEQMVRQTEQKLKNGSGAIADADEINEYAIEQLQNEIENQKQQYKRLEQERDEKMANLDREKRQLKAELAKAKIIFQTKQKQIRLNKIKEKEVIRLEREIEQNVRDQDQSPKRRRVGRNGRDQPSLDFTSNPRNRYDASKQSVY